jgi:hypothetical protein
MMIGIESMSSSVQDGHVDMAGAWAKLTDEHSSPRTIRVDSFLIAYETNIPNNSIIDLECAVWVYAWHDEVRRALRRSGTALLRQRLHYILRRMPSRYGESENQARPAAGPLHWPESFASQV